MKKRSDSTGRKRAKGSEGLFSLPRILAMLAICLLPLTPFLPWMEAGGEGALTLRDLTDKLVGSGALSVDLWPLPLILAALFLLPLLTDLRLTRAVYYLLIVGLFGVAVVFLYPTAKVALLESGLPVNKIGLNLGFYLFLGAMALVMLSGFSTLWRSRGGILILVLAAVSTGAIIAGNLTGWFGYLTGEPKMWHEGYEARHVRGPALGVHLNIMNEGLGKLKLRLDPIAGREEISLIVSAQRYYRVGNYWADASIYDLMQDYSKDLFPAEIEPGDVLVVDLIFGPLTKPGELNSIPFAGASGRYSITLSDTVKMRTYRHEIIVPPAAAPLPLSDDSG